MHETANSGRASAARPAWEGRAAGVLITHADDHIVTIAKLALETAFQPIVEIETGDVHGYEALMRGHDRLGVGDPGDLLDRAAAVGRIGELERMLHARALARFTALDRGGQKVFVNLDGRALDDDLTVVEALVGSARQSGLAPCNVVVELSERNDHLAHPVFPRFMRRLREAGFHVALDDFGTGFSDLRMLCDFGLDYIKIDGSFLRGMAGDGRKRLFVTTLTDLAHVLGVRVVAEGVEEEVDYLACREAGCDLLQGWYVARATTEIETLPPTYAHVCGARVSRRRVHRNDALLVRAELEAIPALAADVSLEEVFEAFRRDPGRSYFPVVGADGSPAGIVHERDLKAFIYNPFGRDLLRNRAHGRGLAQFLTRCPIADVGADTSRMLDIFAHSRGADCVVVTENLRYLGVLSATALLKIMSEKNIRRAQDQNPLTELPGNLSIADHVAEAALDGGRARWFCYFDFDHFKPFNDRYGFRQGDKAITLFATIMRRHLGGAFLGHVGGDDFFAGLDGITAEEVKRRLEGVLAEFARLVVDLYDPADRAAGGILALDRQDQMRLHPPMRCSAAVLELPMGRISGAPDRIGEMIAEAKSEAKRSASGLVFARFREREGRETA